MSDTTPQPGDDFNVPPIVVPDDYDNTAPEHDDYTDEED